MAKRGRPATGSTPVVFHIQLRLTPGLDDGVIAYLHSAPPRLRAQYVLRAMQSGALTLSAATLTPPGPDSELLFDGLWQ